MRTFLAIDIPDQLREKLAEEMARLDGLLPANSVRWVRPAGIHLTLKFLGDVEEPHLAEVKEVARRISANAPTMRLAAVGFGVFPHRDRPRVLWVGVNDGTGALDRLHRELEAGLEARGFERERHEFTPHLTLGRVERGLGSRVHRKVKEAVKEVDVGALGQVEAEELILYHSDLRPGGASYTPLATFPFEGHAAT